MLDNFISKPSTIKISDISSKFHSLMPSEHRKVFLKNKQQILLSNHCISENVGEQIEVQDYLSFNTGYYLGTISCMNNLIFDETKGENIPPLIYKKSSRKLIKGCFIISRNASLGKISYFNSEKKVILNGGISFLNFLPEFKYYVPAFFITKFGSDYLSCITSGGGTQQNAKRGNLLSIPIPHPTIKSNKCPNDVVRLISLFVENLISKEQFILQKQNIINQFIIEELKSKQKSKKNSQTNRISQIINNGLRFDSGMYSSEFKFYSGLINDYTNGFFQIPYEDLSSGSTPDVRYFSNKGIYKWVTPTDIKDEGFFNPSENISMPSSNNINKDSVLFINRTSKGKKGEYVGITCFYDYLYYGKGHHNQGVYRVESFDKTDKLFIVAFMNSTIMRKLCGFISQGTKMKEMKMGNFSDIKFPKFEIDLKLKIVQEYYNCIEIDNSMTFDNYLETENKRNSQLGIFQLNQEIHLLREKLSILIEKIVNDEKIEIYFT